MKNQRANSQPCQFPSPKGICGRIMAPLLGEGQLRRLVSYDEKSQVCMLLSTKPGVRAPARQHHLSQTQFSKNKNPIKKSLISNLLLCYQGCVPVPGSRGMIISNLLLCYPGCTQVPGDDPLIISNLLLCYPGCALVPGDDHI